MRVLLTRRAGGYGRARKLEDVEEQLAELQRKRSELASECV